MSNLTWARGGGGHGGLGWRFLKVKCDHNNIMCRGREGGRVINVFHKHLVPCFLF